MRRAPHSLSRSLDGGETVILRDERDDAVVLNAVGSAVWALIDEAEDLDAIVAVIAERFPDTPRERIAEDVASLISALTERGLVEP